MRFNFRKIASALASTAMVGSTVALAAAANFPAPFVNDGAADVAIVYGENLDLGAVTDISTSLSSALSTGEEHTGAPLSEEAYPLFTSSTPIQLNNTLNTVRSTITETSLPSVLSDTDFSGDVDAEASFQVILGSNPRTIYAKQPTSSDDPQIGVTLATTAANYLYNATVTFDKAVNFSHTDSEGESMSLFGQEYTVSSATDGDTLVLFKSASTLYLRSDTNPSQTVEVDGETYTIELVTASDTSATVKVTDASGTTDQKEINEAASKKILGVEVAVNTADESTATNVVQAEVLIGADRLTFEDGSEVKIGTDQDAVDGTQVDFASGSPGAGLTKLTIQVFAADGSSDAITAGNAFTDPVFGTFRVAFDKLSAPLDSEDDREEILVKNSGNDKMTIDFADWQGDEVTNFAWLNNESGGNPSAFLGDSEEWRIFVREMDQINESAFAMVGNEDEGVLVKLDELTNITTGYSDDVVKFKNVLSGDTYTASISSEGSGTVSIEGAQYTVTYADNKNGDGSQNVRLNYPDSSGNNIIVYPTVETSKGAKLAFYEPITIDLGNWDGAGSDAANLMLPDGDGYTTITAIPGAAANLGGNATINGVLLNATASTTVAVGALTYNFTAAANTTTIYLLDNMGSSAANLVRPAIILFEEEDESNLYNAVVVETAGAGISDNGAGVTAVEFTWNDDYDMANPGVLYNNGYQQESDDDLYNKMDQWGTLVTIDQSNSDQYTATISYPDEQTTALVYLDSTGEGSSSTTLGDVKVLDSELATSGMQTKNLIVVGGSCVNSVAATLVGSNAACGASWTAATGAGAGEWIIQTWANPWAQETKIATLVAGYEQADTANAATYLTTQDTTTVVGSKLKGTTATTATVITSGTSSE